MSKKGIVSATKKSTGYKKISRKQRQGNRNRMKNNFNDISSDKLRNVTKENLDISNKENFKIEHYK